MWRGLHFLAAVAAPIILIAALSCARAKEEKADLGPEVAPEQIDLALSKAIHGADLSSAAVGQYVTYSVIRRLEAEDSTINLGYTKVNVFDKAETAEQVKFTLKIEKATRLGDGTFEVRQSEEPLILKKAALTTALAAPLNAAALARSSVAPLKKVIKTSFHRLRESDGVVEAPKTVKARPGCGGLSSCQLPARFIQFDLIEWYNDDTYQKISLDFAFSLVTPYLPFGENFDQLNGLLITDCRATLVPVEGRTVYVRDCMSLEDFQK